MPRFHRVRWGRNWSFFLAILSISIMLGETVVAQDQRARKKRARAEARAKSNPSPGQPSLANIPLLVGHEAKGIVLPDFDLEGKLRGRFEAGTARRIDDQRVGFGDLKITTFTAENDIDLTIQMSDSVLNLSTRVLSSHARTTIKRTDFEIAGDAMEFNTQTRKGALSGNVKMVIHDSSRFAKGEE